MYAWGKLKNDTSRTVYIGYATKTVHVQPNEEVYVELTAGTHCAIKFTDMGDEGKVYVYYN